MRFAAVMSCLIASGVMAASPAHAVFTSGELELEVLSPASFSTTFGPTDTIEIRAELRNMSGDKTLLSSEVVSEFIFSGNILGTPDNPGPYKINFASGLDFDLNAGESQEYLFGTLSPRTGAVPIGAYSSFGIGFESEQLDSDEFPPSDGFPEIFSSNRIEFTVVPLPASIWFLMSGLGGVAWLTRRAAK